MTKHHGDHRPRHRRFAGVPVIEILVAVGDTIEGG